MRRRRPVLQVSTFPFLAVLLCAMGSLILLLLVLDRRAKIVAQSKARQAAQVLMAERAAVKEEAARQATARRQAEKERRVQSRHHLLMNDLEQLGRQRAALEGRRQKTERQAEVDKEKAQELEQRLSLERRQVDRAVQDVAVAKTQDDQARQLSAATRKEMASLTIQLNRLEEAFGALQAARQRQVRTYSLVPYKGRRGENRRPLYLECTGRGLVFHPDRLCLEEIDLTPEAIRREVERRLGRQQEILRTQGVTPQPKGYLMMLVRPNGIVYYYAALSALQGQELEFGYEFVDPDWILDFSEDQGPGPQGWMIGEKLDVEPSPNSGRGARGERRGASENPWPKSQAPSSQGGKVGEKRVPLGTLGDLGQLPPLPGTEPISPGLASSQPVSSERGKPVVMGWPGPFSRNWFERSSPAGFFLSPIFPGRSGIFSLAPQFSDSPFDHSPGFPVSSPKREEEGTGPALSNLPPLPPGGREVGSEGVTNLSRSKSSGLPPVSIPNPDAVAGSRDQSPGLPSLPWERGIPGTSIGRGQPGANNGNSRSLAGNSGSSGPNGDREGSAPEPGGLLEIVPLPKPPSTEPHSRPFRLMGNRDWVIPIECLADGLVLRSLGQRFSLASLKPAQGAEPALVQAVRQVIARRQASVRPGDPPYRPQLRFLIHADGLRTYHLAYPTLEPLKIPMTRENVQISSQ